MAEPLELTAVSASAETDSRSGGPIVIVRLSDGGRKAFAAFSTSHLGFPIDFRIDGKSLMKPVIREPITGGVLHVPMNSLEEARQLAGRISQGPVKLEVEPVPLGTR
jgi:preprotein translocase subunit SecD